MSKTANATVKTARAPRKSKKTENKPAVETSNALALTGDAGKTVVPGLDEARALEAGILPTDEEAQALSGFPVALVQPVETISVDEVLTPEEFAALQEAGEQVKNHVSEDTPENAPETHQKPTGDAEPISMVDEWVKTLQARNAEAPSKDIDFAINAAKSGKRAIDALALQPEWAGVCERIIRDSRTSEKRDGNFIAVKALVKVAHALTGMGAKMQAYFDPYSRCIIANLAVLNGVTNKSALVCLSKSVNYDALDQEQALVKHYNCSAGTATTQASSTRMMLRALGVCDVVKGKRGDVTTIQENERALQLLALFAPTK